MRGRSSTCPARNWRFAVVGAGFDAVKLLDAVRLGVLGELLDAVKFLDAVELVDVSGDGWGGYSAFTS